MVERTGPARTISSDTIDRRLLAFLEEIKEDPEDLSRRLILADWLQEQDDLRGELVRVQCQLALYPCDDPRWAAWGAEEQALLRTHSNRWLGPLANLGLVCTFRRGLLHLYGSAQQLIGQRRLLPPETFAWVESLHLTEVTASRLARLSRWPHWRHLVHLLLGNNDLPDQAAAVLASSSHLIKLQTLELANNRLGPNAVESLGHSPHLAALRHLNLSYNRLGDSGAELLANGPRFGQLTTLLLNQNRIGDRGAQALVESPHLQSIGMLNLYGNPVGPAMRVKLEERFGDRVYW